MENIWVSMFIVSGELTGLWFHTPGLSLLRSVFLTGVRAPFFAENSSCISSTSAIPGGRACPKKEAKKRTSHRSGLRLPENKLILSGTDRLAPR